MEEERLIQLIRLADPSIKDDLLKFSKRTSLSTKINIFSEIGNCITSLKRKENLINTQIRQMESLIYCFLYEILIGREIDQVTIIFSPETLMGYSAKSPNLLTLSDHYKSVCQELTGKVTIIDAVVKSTRSSYFSSTSSIYLILDHDNKRFHMDLEEFSNLIPQSKEAGK